MRVLFVSNYFPPEVNAPATRTFEHARQWRVDGHDVAVLTSVPNFPEGQVYEGYANRFCREETEGIEVLRVPMYVAENRGTVKRTLSYLSFMLTALFYCRRIRQRPDLVVATSPQFFAALGGYYIARLFRVPFVLEVRDLWPESIVAVGAVRRGAIIRLFERLELFLYRTSDHIVVVTDAFKAYMVGKGIPEGKISIVKNGFDFRSLEAPVHADRLAELRRQWGMEGKFVAAYVGTIGMAHGVEVMLEAARRCDDPDVLFAVIGTGAERERLAARAAQLNLPNFRLIDKQPKQLMPYLLALTDVSVVHLKASPLFETVIPSKIFEAMATETPIVLGVRGETQAIVEAAGSGLPVPPEDPDALVAAVVGLKNDPTRRAEMGQRGRAFVRAHYDRQTLARRYWQILSSAAGLTPVPVWTPAPEMSRAA